MESKEVYRRLLAACDRISHSWSLAEGLSGLVHAAYALVRPHSLAILLVQADEQTLKITASRGISARFMNHFSLSTADPLVQRILGGGQNVAVDRIDPEADQPLRLETDRGSLMATGIVAMNRPVGIVVATSDTEGAFGEEQRLLIEMVARLAAACHDRCSLYDERRHMQAVEPATGVWSFEFFCNRLSEEIARSRRQGTPLSLLLVDIDGYGEYKQVHGPEAAEHLRICVVDTIREAVRGIDILGKYGLDETLVGLPQTDLRGALKAAERISASAAHCGLRPEQACPSVSIGVAELHDGEDHPGPLIERAQRALYSAQIAGRGSISDESAL